MSGSSIGGRLQGLEQRLRAAALPPLVTIPVTAPGPAPAISTTPPATATIPTSAPLPAPPRRPRPGMPLRPRGQLELHKIPANAVSQASIETDNKLRSIHDMSGLLTIDGRQYRSEIADLQHLGELGNGTCGHVVKMRHQPSQAVIAVKQMRRSGNSEENKRILMDLEVVLRSHDCPYIVKCLGYFITAADVWICMELMASCFDKILKRLTEPIPEEVLGKVTVATVNALSYLKEAHGVIHRDVKPSNILVDERGVVKLCDFGISGRLVDSKAKTRSAGCAAYMAPERIDPPDPQKPDYDIRADVWSLGITLVELATGYFPYRDCQNDFEVLSKVIEEEPPALPDTALFSEEFKSFVHKCLTKDYLQRPKYAALLRHPFVERAAASGTNVGSWVSSALPPGSPRIATTPLIFRRRNITTNTEETSKPNDPLPSPATHSNGLNLKTDKQLPNTSIKENETATISPQARDKSPNIPIAGQHSDHSSSDNEMLATSSRKNSIINSLECNVPQMDCATNSFSRQSPISALENNEQNRLMSPDKFCSSSEHFINKSHNQHVDSKEYDLNSPHRIRSLSNTILCSNNSNLERCPPPKYVVSSPTTKKYHTNVEMRNQPFTGGGPPSFENYLNHNRGLTQPNAYRSPDINRKYHFSPSRNKKSSFDNTNSGSESPRNISSPTNFSLARNDVYEDQPAGPTFRPNEPTNYFISTSACTMSRFSINPAMRGRNGLVYGGSYHQNPGGSCSQPASLEAYGDVRHAPRGHPRAPEKSFSPPLWSPQPAPRWACRERDERDAWNIGDHNHHQQGNTSPIVLQRFYHQQSQRRSRRDWDSNTRQSSSSLSRDASIGRSPEPPRRAHRDPSLPREHPPSQLVDRPLLREWRERELSQHRVPVEPVIFDDGHVIDNGRNCLSPIARRNREQIINEANAQFESKIKMSTYHHHMREKGPELNGDCVRVNREDEQKAEKKHIKERFSSRDRRNEPGSQCHKDNYIEGSQFSKQGRHNGKERDEQGGSRSSSPSGVTSSGTSVKVSRLPTSQRRVAAAEDITRQIQDSPNGYMSGLRVNGPPPQPPPRRTTDSWSLPASPLPTRPI